VRVLDEAVVAGMTGRRARDAMVCLTLGSSARLAGLEMDQATLWVLSSPSDGARGGAGETRAPATATCYRVYACLYGALLKSFLKIIYIIL
jgi:hypothetical protein